MKSSSEHDTEYFGSIEIVNALSLLTSDEMFSPVGSNSL